MKREFQEELGFRILQVENGGINIQMELIPSMIGSILMADGIGSMNMDICKQGGNN